MALTQAQWLEKLKSFLPAWFFQEEHYQEAHFNALAKLLATLQADCEEHKAATFITQAEDEYLDSLGEERSTPRIDGESDATYAARVRNLANQSNKQAIKALVDDLLIVGTCIIAEDDYGGGTFCDRGEYANRAALLIERIRNTFTVLVDKQTGDPSAMFVALVEAVDRAKALGTLYRVIERTE